MLNFHIIKATYLSDYSVRFLFADKTPKDFDFSHQSLSISKTWDYKGDGGFLPTKNKSSVRKIQIDWQTVVQFSELIKGLPEDKQIFVKKDKVYNSTVNDILERHCKKANITVCSSPLTKLWSF